MSTFLLKNPDCVLIHIPKTAGRSIRIGVWERNYEGPFFGPLNEQLTPYFSFAFVRNPFDRLVSIWRMFSQGTEDSGSYKRKWNPDPELTLHDVLDITGDDSIVFDQRRSTFEEIIKHHSIPMTHPFNALQDAEFVGRFENLENDWATIAEKVGLPGKKLPMLNTTRSSGSDGYRSHFDDSLIQRTEKVYRQDLQTLGYSF